MRAVRHTSAEEFERKESFDRISRGRLRPLRMPAIHWQRFSAGSPELVAQAEGKANDGVAIHAPGILLDHRRVR